MAKATPAPDGDHPGIDDAYGSLTHPHHMLVHAEEPSCTACVWPILVTAAPEERMAEHATSRAPAAVAYQSICNSRICEQPANTTITVPMMETIQQTSLTRGNQSLWLLKEQTPSSRLLPTMYGPPPEMTPWALHCVFWISFIMELLYWLHLTKFHLTSWALRQTPRLDNGHPVMFSTL